MTDATTGQGAEGARRGEKAAGDGPAGRAYGTGGQSNAPSGDRSKGPQGDRSTGPQGEGNAPIVAGHNGRDGRDASAAERAEKGARADKDDGTRSPLVAGPAGHEAAAHGEGAQREGTPREGTPREESHRGRLLPHDECDKLSLRLQHAVAGFVDGPRSSVEEADHVMEEVASRVTDALTQRRRTLRHSWEQDGEGKNANAGDTEQLRLALRDYRELADRLLHL